MIFFRIVGIILILIGIFGIKGRKDDPRPWCSHLALIVLSLFLGIVFTLGSSFRFSVTGMGGETKEWEVEETEEMSGETALTAENADVLPEENATVVDDKETVAEAVTDKNTEHAAPSSEATNEASLDGNHTLTFSGYKLTLQDMPGMTCEEYGDNVIVYHDDGYYNTVQYSDSFMDVGDLDAVADWGTLYKDNMTDRTVSGVLSVTLNGRDSYYVIAENQELKLASIYLLQDVGLEHYLNIEISVSDYDGDAIKLLEAYALDM